MAFRIQVVFDCTDPARLSEFWAAMLHYQMQPPPPGYDSWEALLTEMGIPEDEWGNAGAVIDPEGRGPRIYFQKVPENKQVKNRLHLDVNVSGGPGMSLDERKRQVNAEVERALGLGATRLYEQEAHGEYHVTMADVEGNEFCIQ